MHKLKLIASIVLVFTLFSSEFVLAISDARDVKDIGIDEKLGDTLPEDITIIDENNNPALFKDLLSTNTPTVLNLVYYSCPKLCNFATDGLLQVINETDSLNIGKDYKVLTVSFDPEDSTELAASKALKYRSSVKTGKQSEDSWPFFTADEENIEKLTQSVGFKYKIDGDEFAHPAALIVLTPEGRISRYLYGIQHIPNDFRFSLLEASKGEIGDSTLLNKVLLFCYGFDPVGKKYALKALNIVKAGGVVTLLTLCVGLTYFWRKEKIEPDE
ncbi:MAG: photosynthetic protein synthase I [Thermodesulfobacteriota bacterium]|nr:MAG: photosynthetic protein synthase I [Thermodesulfobacteriota bacterium]